jgi:hypothetical protein
MNTLKRAALAALMSTSLLSAQGLAAISVTSPVPAPNPDSLSAANLATAQSQCDAVAASMDTDGSSADSDTYSAEVVQGSPSLASGPTEVGTEADRNIDLSTRQGAGTFSPAHREILGNPYRNGGSVNMFGMQQAVGGHYSNSAYDFTADFRTTYNIAYTCTISKSAYHPSVHIPRSGSWAVSPDYHGNEEAVTQNCVAFNSSLPNGPANGDPTDQANCRFTVTQEASDEPAYHDPASVFASGLAGGNYNQQQTDNLSAHESLGSGFDTSETLLIGQVVVCISPSRTGTKLPGAWSKQNGYTGDKCTTDWYNGGATAGVPNLNDGSHNYVTVPVV